MSYSYNKDDLRELYRDAVHGVHNRTHVLEERILLASSGAEAGDIVMGGHHARGVDGKSDPRKSESDKAARNAVLSALINQIAQMQADLDQMIADREAIFEELAEITARQAQLKKWQDTLSENALPNRNADGSFVDEDLEALITVYEEQNGHAVDRSDPDAIALIVAAEAERERQAGIDANARLDDLNKQIGEKQAEIDGAQAERSVTTTVDNAHAELRESRLFEADSIDSSREAVSSNFDLSSTKLG